MGSYHHASQMGCSPKVYNRTAPAIDIREISPSFRICIFTTYEARIPDTATFTNYSCYSPLLDINRNASFENTGPLVSHASNLRWDTFFYICGATCHAKRVVVYANSHHAPPTIAFRQPLRGIPLIQLIHGLCYSTQYPMYFTFSGWVPTITQDVCIGLSNINALFNEQARKRKRMDIEACNPIRDGHQYVWPSKHAMQYMRHMALVAETGFAPVTFWLWARRATGLLYPATMFSIISLTK